MKDLLKRVGKVLMTACIWVLILSIRWEGRTLFYYGNQILVQNRIVAAIDDSVSDALYRVYETARLTYQKLSEKDKEM